MYTILYNVKEEDIQKSTVSADVSIVRFNIPIIIHTTVLSAQADADFVETGIPKNAKLYVNFLKPNATRLLKGRFVTDCLFEGLDGTFVSVGSIDDNVHRRIVEQRNTLNFAHYKLMSFLTAVFGLVGLIIFVRIIISGFRHPVQFRHHHNKHDHTNRRSSRADEKPEDAEEEEEKESLIQRKEKTD